MEKIVNWSLSDLELAFGAFLREKKKCRLVVSFHDYSQGIWLEFPPYKTLALGEDFVIQQKQEKL